MNLVYFYVKEPFVFPMAFCLIRSFLVICIGNKDNDPLWHAL